ncbi:MAG TPA: DUF4747 family protein [Pseudolabrys sp.]|nr:DUF4747 family protein [Pseudolabrys sp.]
MADQPKKRRRTKKRLLMGEINIVSQPHSLDTYIEAVETLCKEKVQAPYHGQRYLEIGNCRSLEDERLPNAITGRIFVFSKFNFDDPWLNTVRAAEATDEDLKAVNIPGHLVPEFRHFRYIFDVRKHRFYFEKYSELKGHLSAKAFCQALNKLFQSSELAGKFDEINAFVVADDDAVNKILGLNKLRKLFIQIYRPNPDDDDFESSVLAELNMQNVGVKEETFIKAPGVKSIIPNALTKKLAHLAARYGVAEGWGKDPTTNQPVHVNTETHPKDHTVVYGDGEDSLDKMIAYIKDKNDVEAEDEDRGDA